MTGVAGPRTATPSMRWPPRRSCCPATRGAAWTFRTCPTSGRTRESSERRAAEPLASRLARWLGTTPASPDSKPDLLRERPARALHLGTYGPRECARPVRRAHRPHGHPRLVVPLVFIVTGNLCTYIALGLGPTAAIATGGAPLIAYIGSAPAVTTVSPTTSTSWSKRSSAGRGACHRPRSWRWSGSASSPRGSSPRRPSANRRPRRERQHAAHAHTEGQP